MAQWFSAVQVIESREDLADFLQEHSTLTPGERCHATAEYDRYGVWAWHLKLMAALCVWNRSDPALLIINHQVVWPSPNKLLRTYENLGEWLECIRISIEAQLNESKCDVECLPAATFIPDSAPGKRCLNGIVEIKKTSRRDRFTMVSFSDADGCMMKGSNN